MRAVIYARYSSDQQRAASIDDQDPALQGKDRARRLDPCSSLSRRSDERRDHAAARISGDARGTRRPAGGARDRMEAKRSLRSKHRIWQSCRGSFGKP